MSDAVMNPNYTLYKSCVQAVSFVTFAKHELNQAKSNASSWVKNGADIDRNELHHGSRDHGNGHTTQAQQEGNILMSPEPHTKSGEMILCSPYVSTLCAYVHTASSKAVYIVLTTGRQNSQVSSTIILTWKMEHNLQLENRKRKRGGSVSQYTHAYTNVCVHSTVHVHSTHTHTHTRTRTHTHISM
jgi:hypothetical protein